jgi:hypothetical protein
MLRNYFVIALRHLRQNRIFSIINVAGLAIGLACFILISMYVWDELHYDTYPAAADDIYRVEIHLTTNGGMEVYPTTDIAVGEDRRSRGLLELWRQDVQRDQHRVCRQQFLFVFFAAPG